MRPGLKAGFTLDMPARVEKHMKPHLQGQVRHPSTRLGPWSTTWRRPRACSWPPTSSPTRRRSARECWSSTCARPHRSPLHVFARLVRLRGSRVYTRTEVHSRGRKLGEGSVLQVVMTRSRFAKLLREAR